MSFSAKAKETVALILQQSLYEYLFISIYQKTADLVTFTKEILNGKLHFLCSDSLLKPPFDDILSGMNMTCSACKTLSLYFFCFFSFSLTLFHLLRFIFLYVIAIGINTLISNSAFLIEHQKIILFFLKVDEVLVLLALQCMFLLII